MDYTTLANQEAVTKTAAALKQRGVEPIILENGAQALAKIKELIPRGASVMNGTSATLEQIGYIDYLKSGQHPWKNLHEEILKEKDPAKQSVLRRQATLSDYYLGSVHALAESGEFVIASNSGSQLPHIVYSSPNLIFVVSTMKIVPTLAAAMERLHKQVIPLEDQRLMKAYGAHTYPSKVLTFNRESPTSGRKVRMILVKEKLGF